MDADEFRATLRAMFTDEFTPTVFASYLTGVRNQMVSAGNYAEASTAEFMTVRWQDGLSITWDEGKLTAIITGLGELPQTVEDVDLWLAALEEISRDGFDPPDETRPD